MEYLLAVAETGSTAAAARLLHVSQPSISVAIGLFEDHFGEPLFLRQSGQGMLTTPFGRIQLDRLKALRSLADSIFSAGHGDQPHTLTLGVYSTLGPRYAPDLIRRFTQACPGSTVTLLEDDIAALVHGLETGRLDLALLYDVGLPDSLHLTPLTETLPYVLLPPGHPLAGREQITLDTLAGDPVVMLDLPYSRGYFLSLFQLAGVSPRITAETRSIELLRAMVANGLGIGLLATDLPYDLTYDGKRVAKVQIAGRMPASRVVLAHRADLPPTTAMAAFTDLATQTLSGGSPPETDGHV